MHCGFFHNFIETNASTRFRSADSAVSRHETA